MIPACLAELRTCAPADLSPIRQATYDFYEQLVDEQLEYHVGRLRRQRKRRPRQPNEVDYGCNIRREVADEISDCRQRLFLGLATGVERLRMMPTLPANIESYLRSEIRSQGADHHREDSFDVIPPASTNATRSTKYPPLKRRPNTVTMDDGVPISILEKRSENAPYMPSAQQDQDAAFRGVDRNRDADQLRDAVARTPEEREILDRLEHGEPRRKIAMDLDVTEHRVRLTIDLFAQRCSS